MESRPINSQGLSVTSLVACLGLFLLIVVFTISTLCGDPSEAANAAPLGPPGISTAQTEPAHVSVSSSLTPQAVEVSAFEHSGNQPHPGLRVISFSLAGLASSEPLFNGLAPVTPAEADMPSPFTPAPMQASDLEDASLVSLIVVEGGAESQLIPAFDPDVTSYGLTANAATVNVAAETTEAGARIISTAVGDEITVQDPPGNRLAASVALAEGATTEFSVTVQARDGVTTRTYHVELFRPGPASLPDISTRFGLG